MSRSIFLLLLLAITHPVFGQDATGEVLAALKKLHQGDMISYDYKMVLRSNVQNKRVDSITGHLYKKGDNYLDSNKYAISAVNNRKFCKVDISDQSVYVLALDSFLRKTGLNEKTIENSVIDISDSIIQRYGKVSSRKLANGNTSYDISFTRQNFQHLVLELDKASGQIHSLSMKVPDKDSYGGATGYERDYVITNIKYQFEEHKLLLDRFFKEEKNRIVLKGKYATYHLIR
ncbi:MAG: hypothetical protein JST82_13870 [Bacteroidetes bacterium]|nr:hypothetical protein [Bacteroidota bacterium]